MFRIRISRSSMLLKLKLTDAPRFGLRAVFSVRGTFLVVDTTKLTKNSSGLHLHIVSLLESNTATR